MQNNMVWNVVFVWDMRNEYKIIVGKF